MQCKYSPVQYIQGVILSDPLTAQHPTRKGQYAVDLLHFLLEKRHEDKVTIVKVAPGDNNEDVVAGLNVLTETLNKLKNGK